MHSAQTLTRCRRTQDDVHAIAKPREHPGESIDGKAPEFAVQHICQVRLGNAHPYCRLDPLRSTRMASTIFNHAVARSARRGWTMSRRNLRLCVNIFRARGLKATSAVMMGLDRTKARESALKRLRFSDPPLILRFPRHLNPTEPTTQPPVIPSQPTETLANPRHCIFFVIKLQMAVDRIPKSL